MSARWVIICVYDANSSKECLFFKCWLSMLLLAPNILEWPILKQEFWRKINSSIHNIMRRTFTKFVIKWGRTRIRYLTSYEEPRNSEIFRRKKQQNFNILNIDKSIAAEKNPWKCLRKQRSIISISVSLGRRKVQTVGVELKLRIQCLHVMKNLNIGLKFLRILTVSTIRYIFCAVRILPRYYLVSKPVVLYRPE